MPTSLSATSRRRRGANGSPHRRTLLRSSVASGSLASLWKRPDFLELSSEESAFFELKLALLTTYVKCAFSMDGLRRRSRASLARAGLGSQRWRRLTQRFPLTCS